MMAQVLSDGILLAAAQLLKQVETTTVAIDPGSPEMSALARMCNAFDRIEELGDRLALPEVVHFSRQVKLLLEQAQIGAIPVNEQLCTVLFAAADHLRFHLLSDSLIDENGDVQPALMESVNQIIGFSVPLDSAAKTEAREQGLDLWQIHFQPEPDFLDESARPFRLFRQLKKLGMCDIQALSNDLPLLGDFDPECCYLGWSIQLAGTCNEIELRAAFLSEGQSKLTVILKRKMSPKEALWKEYEPTPSVQDLPAAFLKPAV